MNDKELVNRLRGDFDRELRVLMDRWADNLILLDAGALGPDVIVVPLITRAAQLVALTDVKITRAGVPTRVATEAFTGLFGRLANAVYDKYATMSDEDLAREMRGSAKRS
jgi:hypothetical protein